jgi:hypothetical protein
LNWVPVTVISLTRSRQKKAIALDAWAGFVDYLRPGIETHVGDVTDLSFLPSSSIDFAFAATCSST